MHVTSLQLAALFLVKDSEDERKSNRKISAVIELLSGVIELVRVQWTIDYTLLCLGRLVEKANREKKSLVYKVGGHKELCRQDL